MGRGAKWKCPANTFGQTREKSIAVIAIQWPYKPDSRHVLVLSLRFGQTFPLARADKHVCNEFSECNGLALCAGGEESMKNRSGWKHWLFTGLALLSGASYVHGQTGSPYFTGAAYGGAPAMNGLGNHGPMSIAMPGPPPMEVAYAGGSGPMGGPMGGPIGGPMVGPMGGGVMPASAIGPGCACCEGACDTGASCDGMSGGGMGGLCTDCGGSGCLFCGGGGCDYCGGQRGCRVCGSFGGRLGCAPVRNLIRSTGLGSHRIGADGCMACGWGNNAILPGALCGLLGRLAPYAEGAQSQRWFDLHVGTMALARTDDSPNSVVTRQGINGAEVLNINDPNLDTLRFGLLATAALQTGPGSNLELTYFGLNKWHSTATVESVNADLFSVISGFGVAPPNGFDDTDRSISQSLTYDSAIHNGELNFRRRWVAPVRWVQGSWLAGVRYFDLDEAFKYQAIGVQNNGLNQTLRFFNMNTVTRNQLTGFQLGSDAWLSVVPGFMVGFEGKYGVYGNHAEVDTNILSNSVLRAREARSDGETAYVGDFALNGVYRLSYSWSFRASYNYLRVDNVALAPRNFNTAGLGNSPNGLVFGGNRAPFIDVNGVAKYSGFTLGAEYLW